MVSGYIVKTNDGEVVQYVDVVRAIHHTVENSGKIYYRRQLDESKEIRGLNNGTDSKGS